MATSWPRRGSRVRQTSPMAPLPMRSISRKDRTSCHVRERPLR
jgi:hypothetical protein